MIFAANSAFRLDPDSAVHAFCHAAPGLWHQMGAILSATDSVNWFAGITSQPAAALTAELGDTLLPPGPVFLPYLSGERTPHNDTQIRGALTGISHQTDRAGITAVILQGVSFAFRDSLEALRSEGTSIDRLLAAGGGSRSDYWLRMIATALGVPVDVPVSGDVGAALGAARLGMVASLGDGALSRCTTPALERTIEPDKTKRPAY